MLIVNDELIPDIAYLYQTDQSQSDNEARLGGKVMAARMGRCHLGEPIVQSVSPATISTQAGIQLTISGCNLAPKRTIGGSVETDLTDYKVQLTSGSKVSLNFYFGTSFIIYSKGHSLQSDPILLNR